MNIIRVSILNDVLRGWPVPLISARSQMRPPPPNSQTAGRAHDHPSQLRLAGGIAGSGRAAPCAVLRGRHCAISELGNEPPLHLA